ncbi:Mrp/NBP35 family ATP-binding protein [Bartonella sp. TP]|uniref:Mrp/NBP35 family ATP-binding protein n=1 Tax=Bartonella sp. TP TaxID=3057550 RepID=UPI0025B11F7A|nr:Mrp/NBP35 family ATP-binding protein [Bartonella sp. TP]WJW79678.1 Mrp/NBP35 family ATP-binding protein [Bartonella sp. TP]
MTESIKGNLLAKLKLAKLDILLADVYISDKKVYFTLSFPGDIAERLDNLQTKLEQIALTVPGLQEAYINFTMEKKRAPIEAEPQKQAPRPLTQEEKPESSVPNIIAIASGKGGVGKSTSAINIARSLLNKGLRVGLLDLDVYGPSIPSLASIKGKKPETIEDTQGVKKILPIVSDGLQIMSIGFFLEEEAPVIWRGHMATSFVRQMLYGVAWDDLDVLIIDLPPGTGDIQLTLVQKARLTGAIIISTPEELALLDVRRAIAMFRKTNVPILGLIENMSYFVAPDTGKVYHIFGKNGAAAEAKKQNIKLLAQVPFDIALNGKPEGANSTFEVLYNEIAGQLVPLIKVGHNVK